MPLDHDEDGEFDFDSFLAAANAGPDGQGTAQEEAFLQFIATIQEDGELDEDEDEDDEEEEDEEDEDDASLD